MGHRNLLNKMVVSSSMQSHRWDFVDVGFAQELNFWIHLGIILMRPQKPLKDDVDEEDAEKIEEEEEEAKKEEGNDVVVSNKEIKGSAENANKTKKRDLQVKEDSDPVLEENESTKPNGFRQNGSRRKSKPRRAAEAGLEFKCLRTILSTNSGQIGVLPNHAPIATAVDTGLLRIRLNDQWLTVALMGKLLSIGNKL
uniref:ATP synthase F1 complex delta/epsilon subunit N-terminal domain-containing protein n=1 Tax=Ananas comosus var. bracteatus TaxID=296719 RepID=A0A6V7P3E9_ANACO|nr:unnamed protein product [Ananas comosus var. bracteatus]